MAGVMVGGGWLRTRRYRSRHNVLGRTSVLHHITRMRIRTRADKETHAPPGAVRAAGNQPHHRGIEETEISAFSVFLWLRTTSIPASRWLDELAEI